MRCNRGFLLTNKFILQMHQILEGNDAGYRKLPGTKLLNDRTGEVIYTPPQEHAIIVDLLNNLFKYPDTKIEFIEKDLSVSRSTTIRYLEALVKKAC